MIANDVLRVKNIQQFKCSSASRMTSSSWVESSTHITRDQSFLVGNGGELVSWKWQKWWLSQTMTYLPYLLLTFSLPSWSCRTFQDWCDRLRCCHGCRWAPCAHTRTALPDINFGELQIIHHNSPYLGEVCRSNVSHRNPISARLCADPVYSMDSLFFYFFLIPWVTLWHWFFKFHSLLFLSLDAQRLRLKWLSSQAQLWSFGAVELVTFKSNDGLRQRPLDLENGLVNTSYIKVHL